MPEQETQREPASPIKVRRELALMVLREMAQAEKRTIEGLSTKDDAALEALLEEFLTSRIEQYRQYEETRGKLENLMEDMRRRQAEVERRTAELRSRLHDARVAERRPREPKKGRRRIFGKTRGKTLL